MAGLRKRSSVLACNFSSLRQILEGVSAVIGPHKRCKHDCTNIRALGYRGRDNSEPKTSDLVLCFENLPSLTTSCFKSIPMTSPTPADTNAPTIGGESLTDWMFSDAPRAASKKPRLTTTDSKIMIVDDEAVNIKVTRRYLEQEGYKNFVTVTDARRAIRALDDSDPDLVLLDIVMPNVSGLDILEEIRRRPQSQNLPVVILTASTDPETKLTALQLGATDFLAKPVDPSELTPRVRNMLIVKEHADHLEAHAERLEKAVQQRTEELALSRKHVIECLARAAEYRDDDTGRHIVRVGRYAGIIAEELGYDNEYCDQIEQAAQLHDVGKIAIPDAILKKRGQLDEADYDLMKKHCLFGHKIIRPMGNTDTQVLRSHPELGAQILRVESSAVIRMAARIALTHHEKFDGSGYPIGLAGQDIPIEGRITAVADVFDALSSERPYKKPFPRERCFEIMRGESGTHFDPMVLDAFFRRSKEIVAIQLDSVDMDR